MRIRSPYLTKERLRTGGIVMVVSAAHFLVLAVVARTTANIPPRSPRPPFDVVLFLRPPSAPPPPLQQSPVPEGGQPAAPSRVHPSPLPTPKPELIATMVPAPEQPLLVGASSVGADRSGPGLGGVGVASGTGVGSGTGAGTGAGARPGDAVFVDARLLSRPTAARIRDNTPPAHMYRRVGGWAVIRCMVGLDTRLTNCRVLAETPAGEGFGKAGLQLARRYRYAPPTRNGDPVAGHEITFSIDYGCPALTATCARPD